MCSKMMISFKRGYVLSLFLLFLNFLQETAIFIKTGENGSTQTDKYSSPIINVLKYFLLKLDGSEIKLNSQVSLTLLLSFCLIDNGIVIVHGLLLGFVPKKMFSTLSVMIKCYNYAFHLPFLVISATCISPNSNSQIIL